MAKKCFVICPFGPENSDIRKQSDLVFEELIKPALNEKGYDEPYRTIDNAQPGAINTQIITELYEADLVIADLSGSNPNVFYELALRHSVGKPFIHISDNPENIPFDIHGISVIQIKTDLAGSKKCIKEIQNQIQKINDGKGYFENPASELRPIQQLKDKSTVRVYQWELKYTKSLAADWLNLQENGLRKCIENYDKENIIPDRPPSYRKGIAEYKGYKEARNTRLAGDLYYFINRENNTFEGWGNFKPQGSSEPLAISIDGEERKENGTEEVIINFSQPARKIEIALGIQEEIKSFYFSITFKKDAKEAGRYVGKLYHPDFDSVLVCDSKLILAIGHSN